MTIYYVDGAVGNDGNAGTSEGAGNAFETINKALSVVTALDHVYVKASITYAGDVTLVTASTSLVQWICVEGYTSVPGDGGRVTISGGTHGITSSISGTTGYIFKNFIITGASTNGANFTGSFCGWYNCDFHTNGSNGVYSGGDHLFVNCQFYNNAQDGVDVSGAGRLLTCKIYGNLRGFDGGVYEIVTGCLIYNNSLKASDSSVKHCIGNTIDGEGQSTIILPNSSTVLTILLHNIFHSAANSAVYLSNSHRPIQSFIGGNLISDCTATYEAASPIPDVTGYKDVGPAEPGFTDEANDDYTLSETSIARQAGLGVDKI